MRIQSIVFTLAAGVVGALLAQEPTAERIDPAQAKQTKQDRIGALKESLAANKTALKQYTWTETTQIKLKGDVKKTEQRRASTVRTAR